MYDVIIVGAGAGGPVVAKELAARGLDVLLLEAGPRFADPEREWSGFEFDAINPVSGYFRFGPADRSKPCWWRDVPHNSSIFQVSGVGGTTLMCAANYPRAMPGAFNDYDGLDKNAYDVDHLFPFGYRELIPYYEWVEATAPVVTSAMGTKEEMFFRGAEKIGLPLQKTKDITRAAFRPQENAILQPRGTAGKTDDRRRLAYPLASGCTFCGHCFMGCVNPHGAPPHLKAKRSTASSYVPMALTADRWARGKAITLIADAFAVKVGTDTQGHANSVKWRVGRTGEFVTAEAQVVVLAGGAIESPRLWLNSELPNGNDWVGRGFTDHYYDYVIGVMPFSTHSGQGPASAARADFPGCGCLENTGDGPAAISLMMTSSAAGFAHPPGTGGSDPPDLTGRLAGLPLKEFMASMDNLLTLVVFIDDDVQWHNRVMLSNSLPADAHGKVARVEIDPAGRSTRSVENREFVAGKAVQLLRALGATRVLRVSPPPIHMHLHSTLRMGTDESDSVLDEYGEAREVPGLFVADASAMANSLGGPNPILTIQAIATRTAERIFVRYFDGDAWVGRESPISSVDPSVLRALEPVTPACNACHKSTTKDSRARR